MERAKQLKNSRILIKDIQEDKVIADTRILSVDPAKSTVKISASSVNGYLNEQVNALVFSQDGIFGYKGILRGPVIANEVEVALAAGAKKEDRECDRYNIQTEGVIDAIVIDNQKIYLRKPIEVVTENLSALGALIRTFPGSFKVGDRVEMMLDLKVAEYRSMYEIVRIQNSSRWNEEYGCRDVSRMKRR
jgi:hypothetical protein